MLGFDFFFEFDSKRAFHVMNGFAVVFIVPYFGFLLTRCVIKHLFLKNEPLSFSGYLLVPWGRNNR